MKKITLFGFAILFAGLGFSQKIKLMSGNLSPLKGQDIIEVQFTYDNMKVGNMTEADYVEKKKLEADQQEGNSGERWHKLWIQDRANRFEPKFIELFNKYAKETGLFIDLNRTETKFVMVVNTYFTEPGFNVGVSSGPAYVSLKVSFFERSNMNLPIAVFDIIKARGAATFDMGTRITEAYALAGKIFAKELPKYL